MKGFNFGYNLWKTAKGQGGKKFIKVVVTGNVMTRVFEPIPNRDIYYISFGITLWKKGRCISFEIPQRLEWIYKKIFKVY